MVRMWAAAGAAAMIAMAAGSAGAASFEVDQTFDLANATTMANGISLGLSAFGPLDLTVTQGDTVTLRVDFLAGQTLTLTSLHRVLGNAFFTPERAVFGVSGQDTLAFFTSGGTVTLPPAGVAGNVSDGTLGGTILAADLVGAPATFTGFSFTLPVIIEGAGFSRPADATLHLFGEGFEFDADRVTIGAASGAPEPGTWALMVAGFGLAGAALRKRRAATA